MLAVKNELVRQADQYWRQMRQSQLVTHASLYISGNVVQKAFSFLLIPLWARFLTPEDYGITGTLAIYGGVLLTLLLVGLQGAVVRHYYDYLDNLEDQKSYVTSIILFQLVVPGVVIVALNIWGPLLWARFTANTIPFDPYVRLMLWSTYALSLTQIPLALYQAQQKARSFVYVQYGRFLLEVITMFSLVVALSLQAYGVMLSQLIVNLIVAAVVLYYFQSLWFTRKIKWSYIRLGLFYGLPLVPHVIFAQILLASDRFILEYYVPLAEIGLYNLGYMMGMALLVLVGGINLAWTPHYFRLMQTDPSPEMRIIKIVSLYLALIGGVCMAGILFVGEVVYIMMPSIYYGAVIYVAPILFGYLLLGLYYFSVSPIFHYAKTLMLPLLTGFAAMLNILLNLWLIPYFGAIAAAWTTAITQGVLFVLVFFVGQRYQRIDYPFARYGVVILIILITTIAAPQLRGFEGWLLLVKTSLLIFYSVVAYLLLILPNVSARQSTLS